MKTPRISDFDPDVKTPVLKSSLDRMPTIEKPNGVKAPSPISQPLRASTPKPKPESSNRSFIKRTFDLYEDQLRYLTRESLQDRLAGKEGSMNAMVREAIDEWIKKRESAK